MQKVKKIKICNWILIFTLALILASGIQLEACGSKISLAVWLHIFCGIIFLSLCAWHIFLHFGTQNWFTRFSKSKKVPVKILWWLSLLTLLSGIITFIHWLTTFTHSPIGGIHGKIGLLMLAFAIGHIVKRRKFYSKP